MAVGCACFHKLPVLPRIMSAVGAEVAKRALGCITACITACVEMVGTIVGYHSVLVKRAGVLWIFTTWQVNLVLNTASKPAALE